MAARTVENGYFGSVGMSDPMSSFAEKTLRVAWDFGKKSVPENKVIPLMKLPKGFMIDRISVVQTAFADQSVALTFGPKSDNSKTIGGTFTLAASSTLLRSSQAPASTAATVTGGASGETVTVPLGTYFVGAEDVLCMIVPDGLTGDACAAGAFDLCIHGFETFAEYDESNAVGQELYRATLQTEANVSGGQMPLD